MSINRAAQSWPDGTAYTIRSADTQKKLDIAALIDHIASMLDAPTDGDGEDDIEIERRTR